MKNKPEFEEAVLQPHYECDRSGVYFVDVVMDKDGSTSEKTPLRLADCIELIGRGRDQDGNHYRVIEWRDCLTKQTKTAALPMGEISANWQGLLKHGLTVHSGGASVNYWQTICKRADYIRRTPLRGNAVGKAARMCCLMAKSSAKPKSALSTTAIRAKRPPTPFQVA